MTIVEKMRTAAEAQGWNFFYGSAAFTNLVDTGTPPDVPENTKPVYFFLDPVARSVEYSNTGSPTGKVTFTGSFMLLTKSDLDEVYDTQKSVTADEGKWQKNILPKINELYGLWEQDFICDSNYFISNARITDIINIFDENLDGILVSFNITKE